MTQGFIVKVQPFICKGQYIVSDTVNIAPSVSFLQNYLFKLQRFEINVINILFYQVVVRCSFKGGNYKRRREVFLQTRKLHKNKNTILIRRIGLGVHQPIRSFWLRSKPGAGVFMSI